MIITRKWDINGENLWVTKIKFCCKRLSDDYLSDDGLFSIWQSNYCIWCGSKIIKENEDEN